MTFKQRMVLKAIEQARFGTLSLRTPDGKTHHFRGAEDGPAATLHLHDWNVLDRALDQGDIGFGEDYIDARWDTDDLPALLHYAALNAQVLERVINGNRFHQLFFHLLHRLRPNSREGSRRNIRAHYDLGNDFYRLWLDETMTYSSALYGGEQGLPLAAAQTGKYRRILDRLAEGERILEIGCGWGGFAEEAAMQGRRVIGLTISDEQAAFAERRMRDRGMADRVEIRKQDYRDTPGTYDNIVSIEMFEAVGARYWPAYFETLRARLAEGGRALVQTITIADDVFDGYRGRSDFIQKHIFPGGMLPSMSRFEAEARKAGLAVRDRFAFGHDYARTLSEWLVRFDACLAGVKGLGFDDAFVRKWRFYFAYCMAGFRIERTDVVQYELTRA